MVSEPYVSLLASPHTYFRHCYLSNCTGKIRPTSPMTVKPRMNQDVRDVRVADVLVGGFRNIYS